MLLTALSVKKFFLVAILNFPCPSLRLFCFGHSGGYYLGEDTPHLALFRELERVVNLLFSGFNNPKFPQQFLLGLVLLVFQKLSC